ncbi:MAG TPA: Bax inhibitor-1 family protein [Solirubrobacteraceae bacterium]|nr:Bax inhibitor-1 family protein [Solirubrobacteraceae bacterium]
MSFTRQYAVDHQAYTRDQTRGVFGQVMGLVALTLACTALGAYVGKDLKGGIGIFFLFAMFGLVFGLRAAAVRGHEQLAIALLFGLGLILGIAVAPLLNYYAHANPGVLYEAAGSTAVFVGALGAYGYATRRDLSSWYRTLFWALIALLVFGFVAMLVAIPHANVIWAVLGLVVFGGFTIFDFNRLRQTPMQGSVLIAASIFLDVFNVFLFMLALFGGGGSSRR